MKRFGGVSRLLYFTVLFGVLSILLVSQVAFAKGESSHFSLPPLPNQEEPPPEEPATESLELVSRFPVKQGESGDTFEFEVTFNYSGSEPETFDFTLTPPSGWDFAVSRYFSEEQQETILAMRLEPNLQYPDRVQIKLYPLPGNQPEVGEYVLNFEAASASLRDSIELKAVVTSLPSNYDLKFTTVTGRLDFPVKGGEDNPIQVKLTNIGNDVLTNLSFTSVKSEGWGTTFTPNTIESLEPGQSVEADVVMTPPRNTIAGDYRVLVRAGADSPTMRLQEEVDLRIRVQTPTVWGAAGIGIVVGVIAALAVMFRQLGRR
jgi:uncharacterized membrane protein